MVRPVSSKSTAARLLPLALVAALGLAGCESFGTMSETQIQGIIITESMLAKIKPGVSRDVVLTELGTPSTMSTINGEAFYYVQQVRHRPVAFLTPRVVDRSIVAVYFDKNGKVTRVANYGMKDGVVFDFVSRTTPTAGSELDFIEQLMRGLLGSFGPGMGG
jgi:outer membrane protein assembly factor BamE (lipoprotein component of BamABCDE complex)